MDIKSILLGFLSRQPLTGYELKKRFSISFSFFSGASYGSIYPALKNRTGEGLVTRQIAIQEGAPNRKVYSLTAAGKKAFLEALAFFKIWASFEASASNLTLVSPSLFIYCLAIMALARRWDKPTYFDWVIAAYFTVVFLSLMLRPAAAGPLAPTAGSNLINPHFSGKGPGDPGGLCAGRPGDRAARLGNPRNHGPADPGLY